MNIEAMQKQRDELDEAIKQAKADKRAAELKARRDKEAAERSAHYMKMYEEIGRPLAGLNEVQHDFVYAQAWKDGDGRGGSYGEVEYHYGVLAELARAVIAAS